jgi:hypothetical protein
MTSVGVDAAPRPRTVLGLDRSAGQESGSLGGVSRVRHSLRNSRLATLFCTPVYIILRAASTQKQLAKFNSGRDVTC